MGNICYSHKKQNSLINGNTKSNENTNLIKDKVENNEDLLITKYIKNKNNNIKIFENINDSNKNINNNDIGKMQIKKYDYNDYKDLIIKYKNNNLDLINQINTNKYIKDDNLEMTYFFEKNSLEYIQKDKLMENVEKIINKIDCPNIYENTNLNNIQNKINNNFGFLIDMENDLEKTKNQLTICNNITLEEENFIKNLSFSNYYQNEKNYTVIFNEIILKNLEELSNFFNN